MLTYKHDSEFYSMNKPINQWDENDVGKWSAYYKKNPDQNSEQVTCELICVVKRAIFLRNKKQQFEARTIQILSLLLMLNASDNKIARLAQIKTGEGKSVIIAMFAAIKALNGRTVDIVTTSPLLAKRDAENKEQFYRMLNLTVGENSGTSTTKACYKNDIVYGNANDFQFDILKDEYSLLGTRCQRKFDIAIVDEVDSMLIDDNSKICRLSNKTPVIGELKILLTVLWQELNRTYDKLVRINDKIYCVIAPFRMDEDGKLILLKSEEGEPINSNNNNIDDDSDFIAVENPYEFVENHLTNYIENKLLKSNENDQCLVNIPKHLTSFVKEQLNKWILSAWQAKFHYRENIDYLITDGKDSIKSVAPIDYRNTGIIQTNTSWPDGLHQFLQIKHKLRINAESLTTNFLSNVAFFSRYGKNLFGLTGTLGSKQAQDLIQYIYNVDFVIIPSYKYTQFKAFPDKLIHNEQEWLEECIKSISNEAKLNQRAVLVICETKSDTSKIYDKLIEKDIQFKKQIKLYTRSDNDEQNAINNELDSNQIILATNLAGRGTDIGTTYKVEENGGLHVLVTFLPLNTRVEHQAFGRTSRQGKRGTAQLIVFASDDEKIQFHNITELKQNRDEQEQRQINHAKHIELKRINKHDKLFGKFCDLRQKLRQQENDTYKLDSVEELWGFWFKTTISNEDSDDKFEEFSSKILSDYNSNKIFQNPFYLILQANNYIFEKKNYEKAIELLQDAIKSDPIFTVYGRYNLSYALIKQKNKNKTKAKSELEQAFKIIDEILIPQQETMSILFRISNGDTTSADDLAVATRNTNTNSDAEEQIMNRINLLYLFRNQIEQAKLVIEDAEDKEHNVRIEYKKLDEFFSDTNKPTLDINEFKEIGLLGFFQLTQKEPTPWLSIITVGLLGIAQAVVGAALIAFTAGAAVQIGAMLLTEGIGDMITAIKSVITGEFSWEEYAIQKAISVAITICTCGTSGLKEAGRAIKGGFTGCVNIVTGKTASVVGKQVVGQLTKDGVKLVGKQIGLAFIKVGAKEVLKTALDKTVLAALSTRINQEISKLIQDQVKQEVNRNILITEFLAIDAGLHRDTCQNEIEILVNRILHPESNRFVDAAIAIAKGIISQLTNGVSAHVLKIFTASKCLMDLTTFLSNFLVEFNRDLHKLRDKLKIDHILHTTNQNDIDNRTAKEITEGLKKAKYIEQDNVKIIKQLDVSIPALQKHKKYENYVVQVCNDIYHETNQRSEYTIQKSMIVKTLTDKLANYMTDRLNNELINPVIHTGVNGVVENLSDKIERACAGSNGTLKEQIANRTAQNVILQHGKDMAKQTAEERAKDTQNSHTNNNSPIDLNVEQMAQNAETNAPGSMMDIMALSAKLGRPMLIFRNGKYDMTIGDAQNGEPLKVDYLENKTGEIGHYDDKNVPNIVIPSGPTNCLYDSLSAQTDIPSDQLRKLAADGIRDNANYYLKMMPAVETLAQQNNHSLLYVGGTNKSRSQNQNIPQNAIEEDKTEITSAPNKRLSVADKKLEAIIDKFIGSFDVEQFGEKDKNDDAYTLYGYNRDRRFVKAYPFIKDHQTKFENSLKSNEEKYILAPKDISDLKPNDTRGTLRLDHQGKIPNYYNLQIQFQDKSYANVVIQSGCRIEQERLKNLFKDSHKKQETFTVKYAQKTNVSDSNRKSKKK
jgi:preprotein translocase subunit SecA